MPRACRQASQQQIPVEPARHRNIHAQETATISAQVMGRIEQVLVRDGDMVRAGQTLVVLDGAALSAIGRAGAGRVSPAQNSRRRPKANAGLASSTLARYKQLLAEKSVSPQEMDEVTRRAEAAKAQLDAARKRRPNRRATRPRARTRCSATRASSPVRRRRHGPHGRSRNHGRAGRASAPSGSRGRRCNCRSTVDESTLTAVHMGMKISVP